MRFNHPLRIGKWWPVAVAMPRMLKVLSQHPELGCLGFQQWFGRTTILVQYWRDFDSLDRFARDTSLPHLKPWRRFNRAVRASGDVGIWHETILLVLTIILAWVRGGSAPYRRWLAPLSAPCCSLGVIGLPTGGRSVLDGTKLSYVA
jgi:hypothetical protein